MHGGEECERAVRTLMFSSMYDNRSVGSASWDDSPGSIPTEG